MEQDGEETGRVAKKRPKSIMLYGCVTVIVLFLVIGIASYFGLKAVAVKFVEKVAENSPLSLPSNSLSEEEIHALFDRLHQFSYSLLSGKETSPLVLGAREINGFIAHDPQWKDFKDSLYVSIDNDIVSCQFSIPLEDIGFSGKYLNGSARLQVRLERDFLIMAFDSLTLKGEPVAEQYMKVLRKNNFADDLNNNPQMIKVIQSLDSIMVKDGKIIATGRAAKE